MALIELLHTGHTEKGRKSSRLRAALIRPEDGNHFPLGVYYVLGRLGMGSKFPLKKRHLLVQDLLGQNLAEEYLGVGILIYFITFGAFLDFSPNFISVKVEIFFASGRSRHKSTRHMITASAILILPIFGIGHSATIMSRPCMRQSTRRYAGAGPIPVERVARPSS